MIRRFFRIGLLLGLLGGLAFALAKLLGSRPGPETAPAMARPEPWPRLATDPTVPAAPRAVLVPDPAAPSPHAPVVEEAVAAKKTPGKKAPVKAWVDPAGGVCPTSHPVKAKLASKIFHLPGMLNYERTKPDRCYVDADKAEADGLRVAKR